MNVSKSKASQRGIALIMVMIVIVVLGIIAGGFAYSMRVEMRLARNQNFSSEFEWLGRSGVELAKCVLSKQLQVTSAPYHSLNQFWAGGEVCDTNQFEGLSLTGNEVGNGTFDVEITDAERKYNINIADQFVLDRALNMVGLDAGTAPMVRDSILDWIDPDDDEKISGAESRFYERLNPPYVARNKPITDLSELLNVRGIREDTAIYWGGAVTNHMGNFENLHSLRRGEEVTYPVGLKDLFTCIGGKMNPNTASAEALQMIPGIDTNIAMMIVGSFPGRAGPDGSDGNCDDTPFTSVDEMIQRIPGLSQAAGGQDLKARMYTRSTVFEVKVKARIGDLEKEYIAYLDGRNPREIKILYAYWDN